MAEDEERETSEFVTSCDSKVRSFAVVAVDRTRD